MSRTTRTLPSEADPRFSERISTGIAGLDAVLQGGLPKNHLYLIDGEPGTGKTTIGLQFLIAGREQGERGLYVTLSETADELNAAAASHGWTLENIDIFELADGERPEEPGEAYTLFHPAEIELQRTVDDVLAAVEQHNPTRVVFDSLSEMRMLARDPLRFRRQILALKHFFGGRACTVFVLDDRTAAAGESPLHSIAHGVLALEHLEMDYGAERRRLSVRKLRGARFHGGYHDFRIKSGGIEVYPRLYHEDGPRRPGVPLGSGSPEMDELIGGEISGGSSVMITGAPGTGKSVLAIQFAMTAAAAGHRAMVYLFDERLATAEQRARTLGLDLEPLRASGMLVLRQIEPTEMSPGEFATHVARAVEDDARLIVIDSLNGYMQAMPDERLLAVQVHGLLTYLAQRGVTSIMTLAQRGVFGAAVEDTADVSYLADSVILLRYFESDGAVRQAMSVVKKRDGIHERTIREFRIASGGVRVGPPLVGFRGVLTGVPEYFGDEPLLAQRRKAASAKATDEDGRSAEHRR
jgi:circadian clock protein KaiC